MIGTITVPKQWNDVLSVKLGGDFNLVPERWTMRAGVYYETAASPSAYANVDFPGRRAAGRSDRRVALPRTPGSWPSPISCDISRASRVAEADARVYQQTPGGACAAPYTDPNNCNAHYLGQPAPAVNAGTYAAASHLVSLAVVYRYGR